MNDKHGILLLHVLFVAAVCRRRNEKGGISSFFVL
jgi:hypothetical protein